MAEKKKNLLEQMGINVMQSQNLQEKLTELLKKLQTEKDKAVTDLLKQQEKLFDPHREELNELKNKMEKNRKTSQKLSQKISEMRDETYSLSNEYDKLMREKDHIESTVSALPDYREYSRNIDAVEDRYESYVKILKSEVNKVLARRIKDELVSMYVSSENQLEDKSTQ